MTQEQKEAAAGKVRCYICHRKLEKTESRAMCRLCGEAYDRHLEKSDSTAQSTYIWVAQRAWKFAAERRK